jgi:diphthine synthase
MCVSLFSRISVDFGYKIKGKRGKRLYHVGHYQGPPKGAMLFLIGLGLGDERDVTVKGLEAIKSCKRVFLDAYTSILGVDKSSLEAFYGITVTLADREMVESEADKILLGADTENVAFLVVGDPFGATTHNDLYLRASERNIPVTVVHNASILNAIGSCGLQLYSYGPAITIPFFTENWRPDSPYQKIALNHQQGLHTLCLLDIKVKEQSEENLLRGRKIYEAPRYMTVKQAVSQLLESEQRIGGGVCTPGTLGVGMMRIGSESQRIVVGTLEELLKADDEVYGGPLHSFILPNRELHEIEFKMLHLNALPNSVVKSMKYSDYNKTRA